MYNIIKLTKGGIVLSDDGKSIENMDYSFTEMINNHQNFKQRFIDEGATLSNWEDQFNILYNSKLKTLHLS